MCKAVIFEGFLHENIEIPCVPTNFIHFRNPSLGISIYHMHMHFMPPLAGKNKMQLETLKASLLKPSIEEIDDSEGNDFYHRRRNLKCKHCRNWWQEQYLYEHQRYDRKSWSCER